MICSTTTTTGLEEEEEENERKELSKGRKDKDCEREKRVKDLCLSLRFSILLLPRREEDYFIVVTSDENERFLLRRVFDLEGFIAIHRKQETLPLLLRENWNIHWSVLGCRNIEAL